MESGPRKKLIRPAKHFQNLYETRPTNVNFTKFVKYLFRIILMKQKCKTLTLKTFVKLDFYFCGDKNTLLLKYLFLFRVSWSNPFSNYPKKIVCWTNFDDLTYHNDFHNDGRVKNWCLYQMCSELFLYLFRKVKNNLFKLWKLF